MNDSEMKFNFFSVFLALFFLVFIFWQASFQTLSKQHSNQLSQFDKIVANKKILLEDVASSFSDLTSLPADIKKKEGGDSSDYKAEAQEIINKKDLKPAINSQNKKQKNNLQAKEAFVFDLNSGKIFFERNIYFKRPIASLTKLMTALIFYDYFPKGYQVVVSKRAASVEGCFLANLKEGQVFKKEDILYLMLLVSSNQAAYVAQESIPNFLKLMNEKAKELGMNSTYYIEPSGLSAKNQSTAYDLAKLLKYIYKNRPEIFGIQKTKTKRICPINYRTERDCYHLVNIDFFVNRNDFLGGKTGYTEEAGQCLVSIFKLKQNTVGIIVLDSKDRFKESEQLLNLIKKRY